MSSSEKHSGDINGHLLISWKSVGLLGALVALASLGVLITVVSIQDIDTLSTVALVLAILAFAIQIMIFVAQTAAATAQSKSTLEINSETKALLAELGTRSQATNEVLNMQFNKLLDKMLLATQESSVDNPDDEVSSEKEKFDSYLQEMRGTLLDFKRDIAEGQRVAGRWPMPDGPAPDSHSRRRLEMRVWPDAALESQLRRGRMRHLGKEAALLLREFGEAFRDSPVPSKARLVKDSQSAAVRELVELRLIRAIALRVRGEDGSIRQMNHDPGERLYELTEKGMAAARLTIANPPLSALNDFPWLRHLHSSILEPGLPDSREDGT